MEDRHFQNKLNDYGGKTMLDHNGNVCCNVKLFFGLVSFVPEVFRKICLNDFSKLFL